MHKVLDDYSKKSTALDLLEAASNAKSIATGKLAILKMQTDKQVEEGGIYNIWFAVMKRLRATWQVEFHRLFLGTQRSTGQSTRERT